jgi:hypothetical protein
MSVSRKLPPLPRSYIPIVDMRTGKIDVTWFRFFSELMQTLEEMRAPLALDYSELGEMTAPSAPSADAVRIYAEDDGGGKTQLMALFSTGLAQQIAIEP